MLRVNGIKRSGQAQKMKKNSFLKAVVMLGGAKGISQGLVLAASPVLTRFFSPDDFGVFVMFTVFIGLLGGLSCVKYEHALPLARGEREAASIVVLCGLVLGAFILVVCAALFAVGDDLTLWVKAPALAPFLWLIPAGVFGIGVAQVARFWAMREKNFARIASADIAHSAVTVAIQISLGFMRFGPAGLIVGRLGGIVCDGTILLLPLLRNTKSILRNVSRRSLIHAARKHHKFPLYFSFSSSLNSFGRQMPLVILSIFFGPAVVGLYALTRRVLNVPMILTGQQVRKVFYPYAAQLKQMEDLRQLTKTVFATLVQIALPSIIILGLLGPVLFALVFGDRWRDSGYYAQWLCPWLFLIFICTPLTQLPIILNRQGSELVFQITLLILRVVALMIGGLAQDVWLAIGLFAGVSALAWIGYLIWSTNLIGIHPTEILGVLIRELLIATPVVAPLVLARFVFFDSTEGLWLIAVGAGCAVVGAIVIISRNGHLRFFQLRSRPS